MSQEAILKKFYEEERIPVGAKPGWKYVDLEPSKFSSLKEFKNFVWKLFEKGYKIEKTEYLIIEGQPAHLAYMHRQEMWICNKKVKRCYIFSTIESEKQESRFFNLIVKRKGDKFPKPNKELLKKRNELEKKIEEKSRKEREKWLKELEKINKVIEKMDKKRPPKKIFWEL